jgi:DNA-binding GntR family transcriptional regulator
MASRAERPGGHLVDEIVELVRERILQGRYSPGAPLSRRRLAEDLGVSPTLVGESLRTLQREGLVTVAPPGRGARVAAGERSTLLAAFALREVVDGLAARLAAHYGAESLEQTLCEALGDQRAAIAEGDVRRYVRANIAFHAGMIEAARNPLLLGQLSLLRATAHGAAQLSAERRCLAIAEHEAILETVRARTPEDAETVARAHVRASIAALEEAA